MKPLHCANILHQLNSYLFSLDKNLLIYLFFRMKSNSSRGRPIANDSSVQTLFMNVMTMHSKLVKNIQDQEEARVHYEGLQVPVNSNNKFKINVIFIYLIPLTIRSCVIRFVLRILCIFNFLQRSYFLIFNAFVMNVTPFPHTSQLLFTYIV